jgi:16S rRNA (guanine966-N2)-methyltransferase
MRIIGGQARGRHLHTPKGCLLRPTSDRIKEALFNIINPVAGKTFLDLYAGIGSVGIEALSREAAKAVFIERQAPLVDAIRKNINLCGFGDISDVICADVKKGLALLNRRNERFDIIFADPPYEKGLAGQALSCLADGKLLAEDALIIIQHSAREELLEIREGPFVLTDQRKYGDTLLTMIKYYGEELANCL